MTRILEAFREGGIQRFLDVQRFCEAPPHRLRVSELGPLYGLRYRRGESDFRSPVVRQARGIVLEKETNRIVSWAFDKFYEYGEDAPSYAERPNLRRSVADPLARYERKYDGVLIKVVRQAGGSLLVSTNGTIDAALAPMRGPGGRFGFSGDDGDLGVAGHGGQGRASSADQPDDQAPRSLRQAFAEAGGLALPYQGDLCYAFELLHPDVSTVVPAPQTALVHLSTRRLSGDFQELPTQERMDIGGIVRPPEVVHFASFGACRDAARTLPWDDEGFVVADSAGNRVKVKSEAYMAMQRLLADDSPSRDK